MRKGFGKARRDGGESKGDGKENERGRRENLRDRVDGLVFLHFCGISRKIRSREISNERRKEDVNRESDEPRCRGVGPFMMSKTSFPQYSDRFF